MTATKNFNVKRHQLISTAVNSVNHGILHRLHKLQSIFNLGGTH